MRRKSSSQNKSCRRCFWPKTYNLKQERGGKKKGIGQQENDEALSSLSLVPLLITMRFFILQKKNVVQSKKIDTENLIRKLFASNF